MKKIWAGILIIIIIFVVFLIFYNKEDVNKVCIGDNCFVVEVVDDDEKRQKGLMFREELDENTGMLFIFENEGVYPFWMKNTLIPLDMLWMDSSGKIVDIKEADPCESDPCEVIYHSGSAKYVLEINKGLSATLEIEIGEIAESKLI
ncbi:MAG: DUF192 domain-containing protein [Nanoarchaeota archaeon]